MTATRCLASPVGLLRISADARGVTAIDRVTKRHKVQHSGDAKARSHAETAVTQLREYFDGQRRHFDVPLHMHGTEFQQRAWKTMRKIRYGATMSYAQQARAMGSPKAVRAVGSANGANPIPIIVPCHRVIASDGSLGGYALGLKMKQFLLEIERR